MVQLHSRDQPRKLAVFYRNGAQLVTVLTVPAAGLVVLYAEGFMGVGTVSEARSLITRYIERNMRRPHFSLEDRTPDEQAGLRMLSMYRAFQARADRVKDDLLREVMQQNGFIREWGGRFAVAVPEMKVLL